jgi:signal transduction histidine kinase/CheY-like chemotaxis protein
MALRAPPETEQARAAAGGLDRAHRRVIRAVVAAVLSVNVFVAGVVATNLRRSWAQREEQAALSAQSLARLLERSVAGVVDRVDQALLDVEDEHDRQRAAGIVDGPALDAALARQLLRTPDLLSLRIADADGRITRGMPPFAGRQVSVADRDYFVAQRNEPAGLVVSRPAVGRVIKVPLVVLSRRLTGPGGRFDGVVFATITLAHFASILAEVEVGPRGAALLRFEDLSAVVRRSSGVVEPFLEPSEPSPPLRVQVRAGRTSGVYTSVAPKDGIERTYGWRKLEERPFYVLVGLAQADLLATWWGELWQAAVLLALFSATSAFGTGYVLRTLRRQQAAAQAHRDTEARLQQALRLESVGRLAGGVAHDFNNMLSVILGEASILRAELPPDHPAHEGVREIALAGERSRDLTRQLLAFSRKQSISPRVVSLNALVEATRPALVRLIGEDVALAFEPGPDLPPVRLDPGQFDQVLVNLVVNARDAMPGGGRLTLRTRSARLGELRAAGLEDLPRGDYALLTVTDEGHGMDEAILAHIFEPFYTTKPGGRGTGLGLATTYGIVQQNGGAILVASVPGQGTTFSIYLPAAVEPIAAGEAPSAPPARGRGTVLLAEDEASVRRTTRRLLESLGYRVVEAATGDDVLAAARITEVDLLLTDVVLPGMKGPEIAARVQGLRPGLPTVFMSGYAASVLGTRGELAADVHFLQKPFAVADLARKLEEAIGAGEEGSREAGGQS